MTITAKLVSELREKTGAGMMDCKKALVETNGDFEGAIDWLRKKGLSAAAKKSGRTAADGLIVVMVDNNKGAIMEINAETDFVAKNDNFQSLANNIIHTAINSSGSIDQLLEAKCMNSANTVKEEITRHIAVIGENINLRRFEVSSVNEGVVGSYIHNTTVPNMGKIGVLTFIESKAEKSKLLELAKKLCMHIAATNPLCLSEKDIDPAILEKERKIFTEMSQEKQSNPEILNKMVEGRLNKYKAEVALLSQAFVMDNKLTVGDFIKQTSSELGTEVQLVKFIRYELGEGIEVEKTDFAAEVASLT